jgi:hypothetical protein
MRKRPKPQSDKWIFHHDIVPAHVLSVCEFLAKKPLEKWTMSGSQMNSKDMFLSVST